MAFPLTKPRLEVGTKPLTPRVLQKEVSKTPGVDPVVNYARAFEVKSAGDLEILNM